MFVLRLRGAITATFALGCLGCGPAEDPNANSSAPAITPDAASPSAQDAAPLASALDAAQPALMDASAPVATKDAAPLATVDAQPTAPVDAGLIADAALLLDATPIADAGLLVDAAIADAAQGDSAIVAGDGGALPAAQMRSVKVGSADRTFLLYVPAGLGKAKPVPLISVHHGFTMSGKIMEEITTWKSIASREGFVVAFADGGDFLGPWNVGENVCNIGQVVAGAPEQDDLGFVQAIIANAQSTQAIDKAAVFVAGFSMGGYFANHVGCQGRSFVRAVSAHSGGTYGGTCPGNPVPVLLIHGDADGLIDYECATQARGYWIERNGCTSQVMNESIKGGTCDWNQGCPKGLEVGLCTMKGMDHGWAGAPTSGAGAWLTAPLEGNLGYGGGVQYEDAAELMWKFFKRYL